MNDEEKGVGPKTRDGFCQILDLFDQSCACPDRALTPNLTCAPRSRPARGDLRNEPFSESCKTWEEQSYLSHEKVGRKNRYSVTTALALRHPIEAHRKIGDLLQLIAK